MSTTVSISQPGYLPWPGHFDRIARSDLHIVLDSVQYSRGCFINRNRIRTRDGWRWLTVPVVNAGHTQTTIRDMLVAQPFQRKHIAAIEGNYSAAKWYGAYRQDLHDLYSADYNKLVEVTDAFTDWIMCQLGISTPVCKSSVMLAGGRKSQLVLNICLEVGATRYISGPGGRNYLDVPAFEREGIEVVFHDYECQEYEQASHGWKPGMSVLDLLLNHGPDSMEILRRGGMIVEHV